jgi:outer membrane protein assembly factor BamB
MKRYAIVGSLLVAGAGLARAEQDFLSPGALREAGLVKFWQLQLPLDPGQRLVDAFYVDDQLYFATQDGYVFAVHADTGAIRWLRPVTHSGYRIKKPAHAGDRVIIATPTSVQQFDRRTGDPLAKVELPFACGTGVATDGWTYVVGGLDRRVYARDVQSQFGVWKFLTNGPVSSTPAMYGGTIFVASDDGGVYAARIRNKGHVWIASTFGSITADLWADENGVYVASRDQSLYLFDLTFGQVRWRTRLSGPLYEAPVVAGETAYQYCPDDGLVAIHTAVVGVDDQKRWVMPRGRSLLTVGPKYAYILSRNGYVFAADPATGQISYTIPAPGFTLFMPAPNTSSMLIANPDGRVFCARPVGVPFVRREEVLAALLPPKPAEEAPATAAAPSGAEEAADMLASQRVGAPLGGKSNVTRDFGKGEKEKQKP